MGTGKNKIFPVIDEKQREKTKNEIPYSFGVKLSTAGHHFVLLLSNTTVFGPRELMWGTETRDLRLGFVIQRIF